ncbi:MULTISPECIES: DUF523 domain-containing protein [Enterococcus]|uniref:DUF523 domain-containing protein n=1 Tax=Candidatus Enterococcus ferrettii TaxID=2815324 RepID=A0ABV0ER19_9ENTE|nr:DUF523 domain-containing protein [Enterococcus sp. 665A]MBO1341126.1 DUF523 domain-containing protein [Enterococcus sp. 665A]
MIGISACLAGVCCRYDGNHNQIDPLKQLVEQKKAVIVCPEVLGGLPTPRTPAEIVGGDGFDVWQEQAIVVDQTGENVTELFKQGAINAYQEFKKLDVTQLILKERSPSCGSQLIYDGSFSGTRIAGVGVATAYFINQGITVFSEENWQAEEGTHGD